MHEWKRQEDREYFLLSRRPKAHPVPDLEHSLDCEGKKRKKRRKDGG